MRRSIDEPDFVHGDNGYRMGCGCGICTEAQRARRARYEDKKRSNRPAESTKGGASHCTSSVGMRAGILVEKTRHALDEIEAVSAEAGLLREQALIGARMVDDALASGRPHLVTAGNRILNESLDRLKALSVPKSNDLNGGDGFLDQYIDSWNR
ncbi:hypothetical protein [Arthrobacter sp. 162MFSha1.1]|uniref:hypothetical protein n=1 Tax=Arthrobacter sp. 162MFSha1.1 TaxID=1151119 RepID=UPI0012DE16DE|nr:hypothetical protein [Arthrobacter sp. 162MFSha1.1]